MDQLTEKKEKKGKRNCGGCSGYLPVSQKTLSIEVKECLWNADVQWLLFNYCYYHFKEGQQIWGRQSHTTEKQK